MLGRGGHGEPPVQGFSLLLRRQLRHDGLQTFGSTGAGRGMEGARPPQKESLWGRIPGGRGTAAPCFHRVSEDIRERTLTEPTALGFACAPRL